MTLDEQIAEIVKLPIEEAIPKMSALMCSSAEVGDAVGNNRVAVLWMLEHSKSIMAWRPPKESI